MKKFLLFAMASGMFMTASAVDTFNTRGNGEIYTLESLMEHSKAGITKEDGAYVMSNIIVIDINDGFAIEPGTVVKMKKDVQIEIIGTANFEVPADKRVTITRYSDTDTPKGIYMHSDVAESKFTNIDFEYAQLRNFGRKGMTVEDCTFRYGNRKLNADGALSYAKCEYLRVKNCVFEENLGPAIGGGGTADPTDISEIVIEDCQMVDNNTGNYNKPQINVSVAGDKTAVIRNTKVYGTNRTKVGAICFHNLYAHAGANQALVEGCDIRDSRFGIYVTGNLTLVIDGNNIQGCEANGGTAITVDSGFVIVSNNKIHDNVVGVQLYGSGKGNLGQLNTTNSPGKNVFSGNNKGESGEETDLQVANGETTYAQNNIWGVENQTEEEIAKVIKNVNGETVAEVIYMPAGNPEGGVDAIVDDSMKPYVSGNELHIPGMADGEISAYALDGKVAAVVPVLDGTASLDSLATGALYIVRAGDYVVKIRR